MQSSYPLVPALEQDALALCLQRKLDGKTKPQGSLGQIERLALRIGLILGSQAPELERPQLLVCAADHGLAIHGISAYPSDVTWQMVENFLAGGAAVSVLARQHGLELTVIDCGVRHDFAPRPGLQVRKIAAGTADALSGPAMSQAQCDQALRNGAQSVLSLPGNALLLGEMGIGNTSAASLLMSRLIGLDIADCTGAGTGLDALAVQRKISVLRQVLDRHAQAREPWLRWRPLAVLKSPPSSVPFCRPLRKGASSWSMALSPVLLCWWPVPCSRRCWSAVFLRTALVSAAIP